ncbi:MAG: threonine/serine dehydratase [Thermoanaerobaculia bacterium]
MSDDAVLGPGEIASAREALGDRVVTTPVWAWDGPEARRLLPAGTRAIFKLELFQRSGTFKPRGALCNMLALSPAELARGVTAVSAGNHAIAVAYAARVLGTHAKVVMLASANPARIAACRDFGAEVEISTDGHAGFARAQQIAEEERRAFIHPFEGRRTALGTATVGWELMRQVEELDAVVVPIGGGGLAAGIANAVKLARPSCQVWGVEPEGADTMHRSFASGRPESIDAVRTIADSLGAPYAAPYSFGLCRRYLDGLVRISDQQMIAALQLLFRDMKLAVEPAGAASTAALLGPLAQRLAGRRVGLVVCGSNIDAAGFGELLVRDVAGSA